MITRETVEIETPTSWAISFSVIGYLLSSIRKNEQEEMRIFHIITYFVKYSKRLSKIALFLFVKNATIKSQKEQEYGKCDKNDGGQKFEAKS